VDSSLGFAWTWNKRIPSPSALAWDTGETATRRRIGNIDKVVTGRALNLPAGELHFTFHVLLAMRALKFELVGSHRSEESLVESNQLSQQENCR